MKNVKWTFSALLLVIVNISYAQKTSVYSDPDIDFKTGLELYDKKKFGAALESFQSCIEKKKSPKALVAIESEFYAAACAIELFHKDGEWRMKEFVQSHPESNRITKAYFFLGKSNFRKKKYKETIDYFEKAELLELNKEEQAEYYFKRGYSYLETTNREKAKTDFYEIKDVDNKYAHPANYYYSHIAYEEKNYQTALDGFNRLVNNETFGSVVPYYIVQIHFLQGKYKEVIQIAPALLNDSNQVQKANEINKIIGESYYNLKEYKSAIPFLLKHGAVSPIDNYQIGFCYFQMKEYLSAATYLELALDAKDSLAQNAAYHLAYSYRQINENAKARNAFYSAYEIGKDKKIREDALFWFAVLSYEGDFSPYNEAIKSFQLYLKENPDSYRKDEAYKYLVNCFYSTKNYVEAIKSIQNIKNPDLQLKIALQKMYYFRAIEFFNNDKIDSAKKYFETAYTLKHDQIINASSMYWIGEIYYKRKELGMAIQTWNDFTLMPGISMLKEAEMVHYNLGYAYFQRKEVGDYTKAELSYRKFLSSKMVKDPVRFADAQVRTADCYFMNKDFSNASDYYETAIAISKNDLEYCLFQKAICNGLLKNYQEKINDLKSLETKYANSPYAASTKYEIAESFKLLFDKSKNPSDRENAISYYEKVINQFPNSTFVNRSIISIGLLYYNNKQDDKAFEYFDKIVKQNPKSEDAQSLYPYIKEIFKAQNKPEELETYFAQYGASVSSNELDEQYYEKARKLYYEEKDCELAAPEFKKYLAKFSNGKYIKEAHFCFSECAFSKNNYDDALVGYEYIISKERSNFSEIALQKTSYIYFTKKNYEAALPLFMKLQEQAESYTNKFSGKLGAMRCSFYLKKYDSAIEESQKVLSSDKATTQQNLEARYIKSKSLFELNKMDEALLEFKYLSKNAKNEMGAEAFYYMTSIYKSKKDYKNTEKSANSLFNYAYTTNDWNTKAMLLLAEMYTEKGEFQNAEATLQAIIDNAEKQEYVDKAKELLQVIKDKQNSKKVIAEEETMKINYDSQQKLFEEFDKTPVNDTLKTNQPK